MKALYTPGNRDVLFEECLGLIYLLGNSTMQNAAVGIALLPYFILVEYANYLSLNQKLLRIVAEKQHPCIGWTNHILLRLIFSNGGTTNIKQYSFDVREPTRKFTSSRTLLKISFD